jgi:uncharacterized membrane protein YbhN (UPF0104 family)
MRGKALKLAVSLALLAAVLAFAEWRLIWGVLRDVEAAWVTAALGLAIVDRLITNLRWQMLLAGRGVSLGFLRLFRVQLLANFIGSFLPGFIGVDAVRVGTLCRAGLPMAPVTAATLVDRFSLAMATLLAGAMAVLLIAGQTLPVGAAESVLGLAGLSVVLVLLALNPRSRAWLRSTLLPLVPHRVRDPLLAVAQSALEYRQQGVLTANVALLTVCLFAVRIAFAKALGLACGLDLAWIDLALVIPVLWVVVMVPITVGGFGLQDAGYVVLMAVIGVAAPVAATMSLLEHVVSRVASLPGAFFLGEASRMKRAPGLGPTAAGIESATGALAERNQQEVK